jgi:branched-chain amino acid transport system substrate-binding protein
VVVASSLAVVGPELPDSKVKQTVLAMAQPFQQANGHYPPQFAFDGYNAVKLIAEAIRKAGSADRDKLRDALETVTLLTPEGEYRYTPEDHAGLRVEDVSVNLVKDGDFVPTDWAKQQLAKTLSS